MKLLLVTLPQAPSRVFTEQFIRAFVDADWTQFTSGDDWPGRALHP